MPFPAVQRRLIDSHAAGRADDGMQEGKRCGIFVHSYATVSIAVTAGDLLLSCPVQS